MPSKTFKGVTLIHGERGWDIRAPGAPSELKGQGRRCCHGGDLTAQRRQVCGLQLRIRVDAELVSESFPQSFVGCQGLRRAAGGRPTPSSVGR